MNNNEVPLNKNININIFKDNKEINNNKSEKEKREIKENLEIYNSEPLNVIKDENDNNQNQTNLNCKLYLYLILVKIRD
jgi:hypothetical protein